MNSLEKRVLYILLAVALSINLNAQDKDLGKVGLTLSGGGAKGLAHIGILQAIDSAGLEISAVTGTSMGAIVGSLYSIGYSGKEIEDMARSMDWIKLILSQPRANEVGLLYKDEYARYPIQLPIPNGETQAYTGVFEAQDIWNELARLYLPVYDIKKFSDFNIPFLCVAADLATGEPVFLRDGDIVTSVRASMAIPSVFTAVPVQNRMLIDGGVVHNFPVEELEEFGVNYRIGVNVSRGLLDLNNLDNPIDVLLQVAFFNGTSNLKNQKAMCDLLIEPELGNLTASSFNNADSIIEIGIATGLSYYPYFKELADSLYSNRRVQIKTKPRLPAKNKVIIDTINVIGLNENETALFLGQTDLLAGKEYTANDLAEANRKAYSSLAYRRINFILNHSIDNHVNINYNIIKAPDSYLNLGFHYNLNSGPALLAGVSSRNKVLKNSLTSLKTNISENFRIRLKHHQFMSKKQVSGIEIGGYYENLELPIYQNFRRLYLYNSQYAYADIRLFKLIGTSSYFGIGLKKEWLILNPRISPIDFNTAENNFWTGYIIINRNTLDKLSFPAKGIRLRFEAASVFNQNPDAEFSALSQVIQLEDPNINNIGNYYQIKLKHARYISFSRRTTMFYQINSGINFDPQKAFLNYYSIGGLQDYTRNQIVFSGLTENEITSNSVISFQLGFRAELYENIYTTLQGSIALYDFIGTPSYQWNSDNLLDGYALSAGYDSFIGPIELSIIYNNNNKNIGGYFSAGIAF